LIRGLNDDPSHAVALAALLKGLNCHVNLIPFNDVKEKQYKNASRVGTQEFMSILEEKKIQVTVRRELGGDIDAACGQLRLRNN